MLISDFYSGYDSVNCRQQKCWVHLVRDINDDLRGNPFDCELETLVTGIQSFLIPIIQTIQKRGLTPYFLKKFNGSISNFYRVYIENKFYMSDFARKYQNRFRQYKQSLFTFINVKNIPWHNNFAESAIRPVIRQETISGSFYETAFTSYLLLLSIQQTCRFQGKSFLRFLFSEETDLDNFQKSKTPKRSHGA